MLDILQNITHNPDSVESRHLSDLVAKLRPPKNSPDNYATEKVRQLTALLTSHPEHATALRRHIVKILSKRLQTSLYTDVGLLSNDGFFTELYRRITHKILPSALDERYLEDTLEKILPIKTDYEWIQKVSFDDWNNLLQVVKHAQNDLHPDTLYAAEQKTLTELLQATQILSYRISAAGLEPELIRIYSDIKAFASPFIMQNVELHSYLDHYVAFLNGERKTIENTKHLLLMLAQCEEIIQKIRKNVLKLGTSVSLTYCLVRLQQNISRLRILLILLERYTQPDTNTSLEEHKVADKHCVEFAITLIKEHNNKLNVRNLLRSNIDLLARTVTENASRTGEHYIAEDKKEYSAMYRSAAGAGLIVGFMAMLKTLTSYLHAPPMIEAFLFSLNYSLGFMLIYVLHFTVATKQPAMTASYIAASLHSADGKSIDQSSLIDLIIKVFRTQFVAVLGNLTIAFPTAYWLASGYFHIAGEHFVTPEKSLAMIHDINPLTSLALFHAGIAGVCLFLAGLISGYYDNKALYTHISERVSRARWIVKLLGGVKAHRLGNYLELSLGSLMGNFFFGILLGSIGTIGFMLGLPIDIRHITFASANFAIALVGLDGNVSIYVIFISIVGIIGIGIMNLWVSFGLALFVALRSRQVHFKHTSLLFKGLWAYFKKNPLDFIRPPKETPPQEPPKI